MARFSVGGDEDENGERSIDRRSSKKPRTTDPVSDTGKHPKSAAAAAVSTPNYRDRAKASTSSAPPPPPEVPVSEEDESEEEVEEESDPPQSDSQAASEEESDADADDDEVQPTEEARGTIPDPDWDNGFIPITLTDKDALDCPICFEPLRAPVYQCENGHIACDSCCTSMYKKCGSCQWPIGYTRCRAIERVIESARVRCRNTPHGCMQTLNYSKKLDHERKCIYGPCSCPRCDYVGMPTCLYTHFASVHSGAATEFCFGAAFFVNFSDFSMKHVFLREMKGNILFVLNRTISSRGSCIDVVCVAPKSTKREFLYSVVRTHLDSSIELKTHVECLPKLRPKGPAKVHLFVPRDLSGSDGKLWLEVKIWKI